jgi:general secretion pathway protein A
MYLQHFGLREPPFSIAVNPRYLFMSRRHRDALAHLLYGVDTGGAFIVLTGEVGTGKTTLNRCLLEQLPDDVDVAALLNPTLNATELLASLCDALGIEVPDDTVSLKALSDRLHRFLLDNHARGRRTVLLIDEAQHLGVDVLEQVRLLTNLETDSRKLLHIILIGQPELAAKLRRPELRQLNQRITARFDLGPLDSQEVAAYLRHRLHVAGLPPGQELFPPAIVRRIYRYSEGIPRRINLICDRLLLGMYGRGAPRATRRLLREAVREVSGEALPGRGRVLYWGVAGLALCALVATLLWSALEAPRPVSSSPAGTPAIAAAPPTIAPEPAASGDEPAVPPENTAASQSDLPLALERVRLPAPAAWRMLWRLQTDAPLPATRCAALDAGALRCSATTAATVEELAALRRPALLTLRGNERALLLVAVQGDRLQLATVAGVVSLPAEPALNTWTGELRYLWEAPPGFSGLLRPGDRGPAVAAVAQRFAVLDGQLQGLTGEHYNALLEERVRLFQRELGLEQDGLIGERTLQALQLASGAVPDAAVLRARIDSLLGADRWPPRGR